MTVFDLPQNRRSCLLAYVRRVTPEDASGIAMPPWLAEHNSAAISDARSAILQMVTADRPYDGLLVLGDFIARRLLADERKVVNWFRDRPKDRANYIQADCLDDNDRIALVITRGAGATIPHIRDALAFAYRTEVLAITQKIVARYYEDCGGDKP